MGRFSKSEFADKCGLRTKDLYVYIGRNHVEVNDDGEIDDKTLKNQVFFKKCLARMKFRGHLAEKPQVPRKEHEHEPAEPIHTAEVVNRVPVKRGIAVQAQTDSMYEKNYLLKNEKLERENELLQAKIAKANEESIPREHVSYLLKNFALGIENVWLSATRQFMMQKGVALGLGREEMIEHEKYIAEIVTDARKTASSQATTRIRDLAVAYAGKRGRGERE